MGLFDKLFGATKKGSNIEPPKNINYTLIDNLMDEEALLQKIIQMEILNNNNKNLQMSFVN